MRGRWRFQAWLAGCGSWSWLSHRQAQEVRVAHFTAYSPNPGAATPILRPSPLSRDPPGSAFVERAPRRVAAQRGLGNLAQKRARDVGLGLPNFVDRR